MFSPRVQFVFSYLVIGVCLFSFLLSQVLRKPASHTTHDAILRLNFRNFTGFNHVTSVQERKLEEFKYLDIHVRLTSNTFRTSLESRANQAEFRSFLDGGKYPCFYEEDEQEFLAPLLGFRPPTKKRNASRNIR